MGSQEITNNTKNTTVFVVPILRQLEVTSNWLMGTLSTAITDYGIEGQKMVYKRETELCSLLPMPNYGISY